MNGCRTNPPARYCHHGTPLVPVRSAHAWHAVAADAAKEAARSAAALTIARPDLADLANRTATEAQDAARRARLASTSLDPDAALTAKEEATTATRRADSLYAAQTAQTKEVAHMSAPDLDRALRVVASTRHPSTTSALTADQRAVVDAASTAAMSALDVIAQTLTAARATPVPK